MDRPHIPADLKRDILVEAGHQCAIPTCRCSEPIIHHIIPWAKCREHEYENLIALCPNCHSRADRNKIDKKSLRMYKNNLRFLTDRFSRFEVDILFQLKTLPEGEHSDWPQYLLVLLNRLIEEGYVDTAYSSSNVSLSIMHGIDMTPRKLVLTAKGRELVDSLETKDLG